LPHCCKNDLVLQHARLSDPVEVSSNTPELSHGHPMQEGRPAEFDAFGQNYSATIDRALAFSGMKVDFFTRVKVDYFVELLDSLRPPAARAEVIDVGCGVANSHPFLAGRIGKLAGVDVSEVCIAKAITQNPQNEYRLYDGSKLPFPDASFDAASAVCVFHHIPVAQRARLARDVRRVLRSGGLFAIFEHNPLNPLTTYVVNNCEFDKNAVLLRRSEAETLLNEAGFRDVGTQFILTLPAAGRVLRAVDKLFARVPLGAQYFTVGRV
jgi:SAM-dependent methyltransferase